MPIKSNQPAGIRYMKFVITIMLTVAVIALGSCGGSAGKKKITSPPGGGLVGINLNGTMYQIDESTGATTALMEVWANEGGTITSLVNVESMAWDENTHTLYAGTGNYPYCPRCIYSINLATGEATREKDISIEAGNYPYGMAWRPSDGTLLATGNNLVQYDPAGGTATNMGLLTLAPTGRGIAFSVDGAGTETLYMGGFDTLYAVDTVSTPGTVSNLGVMPFTDANLVDPFFSATSGVLAFQSLATRPDGRILGLMNGTGDQVSYLVEIQPLAPVPPDASLLTMVERRLDGLVYIPDAVGKIPPGQVTGLSFSNGLNSILLNWTSNHTANSYKVYWSSSSMGGDTGLAEGSFTTGKPMAVHSDVIPATTYYYIVVASNSAGQGIASAEFSWMASPVSFPPGNVTAEALGVGIGVNWYRVPGAEGYNLYWASVPMAGNTANAEGIVNTMELGSFLNQGSGTYYFMVTAYNSTVETAPSFEISATTSVPQQYFDFDNGTLQGWTADGLWHLSDRGALSGSHLVRFAHPVSGTFALPVPATGQLVSPEITLSPTTTAMTFFYRQQGENGDGVTPFSYDKMTVEISTDSGATWPMILATTPERQGSYRGFPVDLSAYAGQTVMLRFNYNSGDNVSNEFFGVYLDSITIY